MSVPNPTSCAATHAALASQHEFHARKLHTSLFGADDALARAKDAADGYPREHINAAYAGDQVCFAIHKLYGALEQLTQIEKLQDGKSSLLTPEVKPCPEAAGTVNAEYARPIGGEA